MKKNPIVGTGQVGYLTLPGSEPLILSRILTMIDKNMGKVEILSSSDLTSQVVIDVEGLPEGFKIAPGSIAITPDKDYLCIGTREEYAAFEEIIREEAG